MKHYFSLTPSLAHLHVLEWHFMHVPFSLCSHVTEVQLYEGETVFLVFTAVFNACVDEEQVKVQLNCLDEERLWF